MKNYLTANELGFVLTEMKKHEDDALEREIVKDGLIAQIIMDDEELLKLGEFNGCDDIYNKLLEQDIELDKIVKNYYIVDYLYKEDMSIKHDIKDFLNSIEDKLDKSFKKLPKDLKDFKLENLVNMLKEDDK